MSNLDSNNPYYGGGGFVAGGSPYGSQESPGGKKAKSNQTLRPITIKQALDASQPYPESDFTIDGADVAQVLLVGTVYNSAVSATNVSYQIGDGTGYIDVRLWLDSASDEAGKTDGVENNKYVSVLGTIKTFGGKRHVSATHIRPITNHDEVFHHMLKAVYVSHSLRGGSAGGAVRTEPGQNDYAAGAHSNGGSAATAYAHLQPLQRRIMEIVAAEDNEDGMHVSLVSRQVGMGAGGDQVMEAIEELMGDGMLFSTIDDLHIKAA
ncbi:Replication factor A protein 2 [Cryptotrichosporon argae]